MHGYLIVPRPEAASRRVAFQAKLPLDGLREHHSTLDTLDQ
jgi:hypothetical protein